VTRFPPAGTPAWLAATAAWLTPRRVLTQAALLALCLWGVSAVDLSTPGIFSSQMLDRAGNVKFQDFLPFYVSARLIATGRASQLYDRQVAAAELQATGDHGTVDPTNRRRLTQLILPYLYGPQVALFFEPLAGFSFLTAAWSWAIASLFVMLACVYLMCESCPALESHLGFVAVCALAFPALFHCFLRGQISVLLLVCFTAAFLALRTERHWLAGIALGVLAFKPQFLVAIPLVLLLAGAWRILAGLVLSAGAQLAFAWIWFGSAVMSAYFDTLLHLPRWLGSAELSLAPIQMHSLRAFWSLLVPWPGAALALYVLTSLIAIGFASAVWKSPLPLALRFSALTLAAVLANPHLFIYDLVVLAPALLLLVDWTLRNPQQTFMAAAFRVLVYLAFVLPLIGPLSRWTHLQLSVPTFATLLWLLWRRSSEDYPLALQESRVV
jgi:alpha-1,2-mannosyltransferase